MKGHNYIDFDEAMEHVKAFEMDRSQPLKTK